MLTIKELIQRTDPTTTNGVQQATQLQVLAQRLEEAIEKLSEALSNTVKLDATGLPITNITGSAKLSVLVEHNSKAEADLLAKQLWELIEPTINSDATQAFAQQQLGRLSSTLLNAPNGRQELNGNLTLPIGISLMRIDLRMILDPLFENPGLPHSMRPIIVAIIRSVVDVTQLDLNTFMHLHQQTWDLDNISAKELEQKRLELEALYEELR